MFKTKPVGFLESISRLTNLQTWHCITVEVLSVISRPQIQAVTIRRESHDVDKSTLIVATQKQATDKQLSKKNIYLTPLEIIKTRQRIMRNDENAQHY